MNKIEKKANLVTGILFKLIQSEAIHSTEKPEIGDWCFEITTGAPEMKCLGMLLSKADKNDDNYVIQTLLGQRVYWFNARCLKIPSELVDAESIIELWNYLKEEGADVIIPSFLEEPKEENTQDL